MADRPDRPDRDPREAALDAARSCLLDLGWRRTTLTEVARRAGVSRMTLYRAWPDMEGLVGDLLTREWGALVVVPDAGDHGPEAIADALVTRLHALRGDALFQRLLGSDPEVVLPYLFVRRGRSQELLATVLATEVRSGQDAARVRAGDPVALARAVLLAAHGFALSAHTMVDDDVPLAALDDALRRAVVGVLAPDAEAGR